jgi:hypothetical protein
MNEYDILVNKINWLLPTATTTEKAAVYYDLAESLSEEKLNKMLEKHRIED